MTDSKLEIVYVRKPKVHMLKNGKALCGRYALDGEEEGSKFDNFVDCKDCLRLMKKDEDEKTDSNAKLDLTKQDDVVTLMKSSKTYSEWNDNTNKVIAANGGNYPLFWTPAIISSGIINMPLSK